MRKRREGVSWMRVGDSFCQSAVLACFYHVLFFSSSRLLCCSVFLFLLLNFIFGICILSPLLISEQTKAHVYQLYFKFCICFRFK